MLWLFVLKQKTAYEMRISDWSSDVCSSDLVVVVDRRQLHADPHFAGGGLGHRTVADDKHVGRIAELVVDGATHVGLRQSRRHPSYTPWPVRASPTPLSGAHYRFHKPRRMGTR